MKRSLRHCPALAVLAALALAACSKNPSSPSGSGLLSGTVVDSAAGAAVPGAMVVVGSTDSAATGADGRFSFTLAEGRYTVQVSKDGYYGVAANVPVLAGDTTDITVCARLRAWMPGTAMPDPNDYRHNFASIFWGGLHYLIGGRQAQASLDLSSALTYSPGSNTWPANTVQILTPGRQLSACAVCRDTLFLFGGLSGSNVLSTVLKLSSSNWTATQNPMPDGLYGLAAISSGDSIFILGGFLGTGSATDSVRVYRPSADTIGGSPWSASANLPSARAGMSCVTVGGQTYLFGGIGNTGTAVNTSLRFNPANGTWAALADMPAARAYAACAAVNNQIFLFGGMESGTARSSAMRYDISGNSWTAVSDLPLARYGAAAVENSGRIHVIGGFDGTNSLGIVEVYNPEADVK